MSTAEQSIEVNVGVTTAYDEGTRFDSFPRWLEGVASVDGIDDTHLRWVAKVKNEVAEVKNETLEWDARITAQIRDTRISWESVGGKPDEEHVTFEPLGDSACRVTFVMSREPEGEIETPTEVLEAVNQGVAADLARFKDLSGARGAGTGSRHSEFAA